MVGENLPTPHVPNVGLTIYVDAVNGDDNNTGLSVEQAFKSLHRAYTYLNSQATWPTNQDVRVYIRQGDYTRDSVESTVELSFNNAARQPNASRWIIWQRYPGDARPRILFPTGTSPTNHKLMFKVITSGSWVGDYQMFIGLELSGQSTRINAPGDAVGMYLNGASNIHVVDCRIHGIYAMNTGGSPTSKAQGIYADTGSNNLFYRCTFYDIGSTSGTINIQEHALYIGGHDNAVIACEIFDCWNGYGIQFYRGGSAIDGSIVCSNTIVGTIEKSCMVVPGHASDTVIKNNILVGADQWGIEFYPTTFTGSGNVISHCIYNGHGVANRSSDSPSGWSISNEQTADPLFTDANNHDFTLQVNSPAIGFADDAWASPVDKFGFTRDNDPDCGAFEFEQVVDDATVQPDSIGAAAGVPAPTVDTASLGQHLPSLHEPDVGLTIYVDAVNGNDGNSGLSVGQPFQTLARAQSYLQNQATWPNNQDVRVYIRQGTYQAASTAAATLDTAFNNTARRPNANRWVIWERYPGDARPKIVPPDGTNSAKMAIRTTSSGSTWVGHYQQFRGLEIDGLQQRRSNGDVVGIYISGGNSTTGPVEIVDCVIHGLYANGTGSTGKAQGVFLDSATITVPHKIVGCRIYDVGTTTQTINIQEHGIYTSAYGTKIYGNVIHDCPNGYGIQVYRSNNAVNDVLIASNTITGTLEKSCIIVPPNSTGIIIKNNILRGADQWGIEFYPPGGSGTSCVATHNLFHDNGVAARSETPSGWTISDEINGDPLFFNYTARDLRLQDNSPAIDAADIGFATVVDFLGYQRQDDPDIGAIERNVTEVVVEVPSVGAAAGVDAATVTPVAQPQPDAVGATSNVTGTASAGSTVVASAIAAPATVPFITFDGNSNAVDKGVGVAAGVPTPLVRTSHTATPSSVGVAGDVPTPDDIIATSLASVRERWTIVSHVSQSTPKAPSASIGSAADRAWVLRVLPLPVAATVAAVAGVRATAGVSGTVSASSTVSPASIGALSALISHIPRGGAGALVGSVGSVVGVPEPVVVGGGALVQAQAIGVVAIVPRPSTVQQLTVAAVASVAALAFVDRPDRVRARRGVRFAPVTRDETDRIRDRKLGSVLLNMATQRARGVGRDG